MIRTAHTEATIQDLHLRKGDRFRILGEREVYTFTAYVEHGKRWRWIECHSHDYGYRALYVGERSIYHEGLGRTIKPYEITSPFTRATKQIAKRASALRGKRNGQASGWPGEQHHHQNGSLPMSETTTIEAKGTETSTTKAKSKKNAKTKAAKKPKGATFNSLGTAINGPLSPKAAKGTKGKAEAKPAAKAQPKAARSPKAKPEGERKPGILTLAAEILAKKGEPMGCQAMVEEALKRGWTTNGKTPAATLYAAIIREIAAGKDARFKKTDKGTFAAA